jgi:outer membrane protein
MKKSLFILGLMALFTFAAQAETKIGLIDLRKVFDGYYKTKQADANLKDEAADKEKERKQMVEDYKKGEEDYKKLLDKSNDQAVSSEERDKAKQATEKKLLELKELEQTIGTFERSARAALGEKQRRKRDVILDEIRASINAKAKANGYTVVMDTAAESINNTPFVLFNNGENDITDAILKELNAAAPPDILKLFEKKDDAGKDEKKDEKK